MIQEIIRQQREQALKGEEVVPRAALSELIHLIPLNQIVTIVGVRRSGKSVMMRELIRHILKRRITKEENILYLNLENPYFSQFKDDVTFLSKVFEEFKKGADPQRKTFAFLDEIQFFRDWQVFVKDLYERKEAKIFLTGSNSKLLSSELATLLSGRSIPLKLFPYSYKEFSAASADANLNKYLERGGFPEIATLKDISQIKLIVENYYKNIIYQDVIPRFGIKNSLEMENLSYYLLSNTSRMLSYNTLGQISKLDDKTIKQYISYLEDANLIYEINNYDPSLKKQIGNKKKIYSVDTSFVNFLGFATSPNLGRLLENAVFIELKRRGAEIYFYSNGAECDFVVKKGYKIVECIQVTKTMAEESVREREIASLKSAMDYFKLNKGLIVTENDMEKIVIGGKEIQVVPFLDWVK